jgi:DNA replication and repair protein RecF
MWLSPANDLTFLSGTASREFLDNLCEVFFEDYTSLNAVYNKAKMQRRNLLSNNKSDDYWLNSLELQMAQKAMAITAYRFEVIERINKAMVLTKKSGFPAGQVEIEGEIEEIFSNNKAILSEQVFCEKLKEARRQDSITGKTAIGIHKTKLKVTHLEKNQLANLCSTGEQKAMLLSITLAALTAKKQSSNITPIILLDEVIAHLDSSKRLSLISFLLDVKAQVWATAVDSSDFEDFAENIQLIRL